MQSSMNQKSEHTKLQKWYKNTEGFCGQFENIHTNLRSLYFSGNKKLH